MAVAGLFYPLKVSPSGDVQGATTLDESMVQSWAQYIIDTERPFTLFQSSNTDDISLGVEKFRYSLSSKCPLVNFKVETTRELGRLIISVNWQENSTVLVVE